MTVPIPLMATRPQPNHVPLRIAVVQFAPKIGQVDANLAKARELCRRLEPNSLDLICFPEMAFTGYAFESAEAILPYLETPRTGPTSAFCKELASRLGCYVAAGYPERLAEEELTIESSGAAEVSLESDTEQEDAFKGESVIESTEVAEPLSDPIRPTPVGANSAIIYGPSGEWVGGYRKTNLFFTDMTWAKPGNGFASFSLPLSSTIPPSDETDQPTTSSDPTPLDISLGICMDLNPQPPTIWNSADGPYELADHCVKNRSRVLVLLNAWLDPGAADDTIEERNENQESEQKEGEDAEPADEEEDEPEWQTLRYWTARLMPLWRRDGRRRGSNETVYSDTSNASERSGEPLGEEVVEDEEEKPPHETIVVVCNRSGQENGKTFAGSSSIFSMRAGSGRPKLLDMMGKREEGVRVWNLLV